MLRPDGAHDWTVVDDTPSLPQTLTQGVCSSGPVSADPTATARYQVLHTPELLETILANCGDMRAVLLAQRVSVFWHDVIRTSSLLQCMLFFEPVPPFGPDEGLSPEELRDSFAINPLLCHHFPQWLQYRRLRRPDEPPLSYVSEQGAIYLVPPSLGDGDDDQNGGGGGETSSEEVSGGDSARPATAPRPLFPPERCDAFTRTGASWRRMLVCQPASLGLAFLQQSLHLEYGEGISGCTIPQSGDGAEGEDEDERSSGLRMGALYDFTLQLHARGLAHFSEEELNLRRERWHPCCLRLYWVPPGYEGLWPFHDVQQRYASIAPGLGTSTFAVLVDDPWHSVPCEPMVPPFVPVVAPRCEEHTDDIMLL